MAGTEVCWGICARSGRDRGGIGAPAAGVRSKLSAVKQLRAQDDSINTQIEAQEHRVVEQANDSLEMTEAAEAKAQAC